MTDAELELFQQRDDPVARARLVAAYEGIAIRLAARYRGRGEPEDDLQQVARLGLLNAIDRFDADYGVKFATYATRTIVGELKRHLRDRTWSIRVPRSLQERWLETNRAAEDLTHRLHRSPTVDEIAAEIGASRDEVLEAMDAGSAYTAGSLDVPVGSEDGDAVLADRLGAIDADLETAGPWAFAVEQIRALPARERAILVMRFFEDKSQTEIAEAIGVSQMHVSRLLRRSLSKLRETSGAGGV